MLGRNCKAYYLSSGTRASWGSQNSTTGRYEAASAPANLSEITSVKEITLPGERDASAQSDRGADVNTEDTGGWSGRLAIKLNHRKTDAARVALNAAFILNTPIALAVLNGASDVVGSTGLWADWKVTKFVENQPETEHTTYDVELCLYDGPDGSEVEPEWVELTAA